jgi:predicted metal-dependent hydrolase
LNKEFTAYTDRHIEAYPREYLEGIDLFNSHEFHAAHDVWEKRWLDKGIGPEEKLFLQAMIQSAVVFYHLENGRLNSARSMYQRAKEKLARLNKKKFMSLDLENYQLQLNQSLSCLVATELDIQQINTLSIKAPLIELLPDMVERD